MRHWVRAALLTLWIGWAAARLSAAADSGAIRVANYQDGETVRHPVVLLRGAAGPDADSIEVTNRSSDRDTSRMKGVVDRGRFKALAELVPGENRLVLRAGNRLAALGIRYVPQTNPYVVRVIYMTDSGGETAYQTPIDGDPQDYAAKLDTAMKLMQTFTAERNHDLGFGRGTFNIELDEAGKVKVHRFKGAWPKEQYYALNDRVWWSRVGMEVERAFPTRQAKNVVIAAYTRFDRETGKVRGHTALGGGALGLFGSGNLFTWPSSLQRAQEAFMDARVIDPKQSFDDSAGRHTYWGAASTTIGATLHEMSHTFGLPHTREPQDIMTRAFDRFHRAFVLADAPAGRRREPREFQDDEVACFAPVSAAALVTSRWLAMDRREYGPAGKIDVGLDLAGKDLVITATHPVRYVGFDVKGDAAYHVVPGEGLRRVAIPIADVRGRLGGDADAASVRVIDGQGDVVVRAGLLSGPFVRTWRFAEVTEPWPDKSAFVSVSPEKLKEIVASALRRQAVTSEDDFVDFLPRFPAARRSDVAGYAVLAVQSPRRWKVKVLTGSDDALRLWVDGRLVQQVLALRGAQPDSESAEVELVAGRNTVVAEVSQGGGGWGLYLRFEDASGKKLRVNERGELVEAGR